MKLVEVDAIDFQTSQRVLTLAPNGVRTQNALRFFHRLPGIPHQTTLGEHIRSLGGAFSLEKPSNHFFRVTEPVNGCGIDPVNAKVDSAIHRRDRVVVVLWPPGERPSTTSDRPRANADAGDVHVRGAQLPNQK